MPDDDLESPGPRPADGEPQNLGDDGADPLLQ